MAIDQKKMKAFVGGKGGGQQQGQGGGDADHEDEQGEGQEGEGEEAEGGKYAELMPILEENAGEIEDAASLVEAEPEQTLGEQEPNGQSVEQAMQGFEELEQDAQDALVEHMPDLESDDFEVIAKHLHDEGMIDDADLVAAWLKLVSFGVKDMKVDDSEKDDEGGVDDADSEHEQNDD